MGPVDQRFRLPFLPSRHLTRPRLLDRLGDGASATALTMLSAGAGAGKTVLLSEWAGRQDAAIAWLALTPSDNDPRRFWRLFLEAARVTGQPCPAAAWSSGDAVELLDSLYGRPAASPERPVIVLDDAHLLTDPEILHGLDRIVQRWSHRVRLMIAARSDPLLPLHRYRLAEQLRELRAADLAMTPAEVRGLLEQHGVRLPDEHVRTLTARTEGWPAGLRLAAMRMEGVARPAEFIAQLAMDEGSIGEYLTEEVLAVLPARVQSMLIRTSFLDDVTGPLAEAVCDIDDCAALLSRLARTNSFVLPVDPARTTYRYHPLFREMLRQIARSREDAAAEHARYARAAAWFRQQGDLANALTWSVRAGDGPAARAALSHGGLAEAFVARRPAPAGLPELARHPPPAGASPAELLEFGVARHAILALVTDSGTAGRAARTPALGSAPPDTDPQLRITALLADLMLAQKSGRFPAVDDAAEQLLTDESLSAEVDGVPGLRPCVLLEQARARMTDGRLPDADPLLRRALAAVPPDGTPAVRLEVLAMVAFADVARLRVRHAAETIGDAEALLTRHAALTRPVFLDLAIACRAYLAADLRAMSAAMRRAHAAGPVYADVGQAAVVTYLQAILLAARGELGPARSLLCDDPALSRIAVGLFGVVRDRELAAIDTALGRPRSALETLRPHRGTAQALVAEVTVARAHLALGDLERATRSVRTVMTTPSPLVDRLLLVDAALCDAEIAHRRGDDGRSAELLDRALQIAAGDLVQPFVQAAGALGPVLSRHRGLTTRWPVPVPAQPDPVPPGPSPLPETLTHREQAVLRLMATSMSTAEIAAELCLSVNTVKTHLAAIYRKLSVGRRREAVSRARQLELL